MKTADESSSWSRVYGYDAFGNRWVQSANHPLVSATPIDQTQFDAATNRLSKTFDGTPLPGNAYDAAGNLTNHPWVGAMAYDAENHQTSFTSASGTTAYQYDGDGRRVAKLEGARTTVFVYDAFGNLAAEYDTQPDPNLAAGTYYRTTDHLGSTRLVTDANGQVVSRRDYFPFGEEIPANATFGNRQLVTDGGPATTYNQEFGIHQKFTGKERDTESNLDYFGARYYAGAMGRFTTPDWSATPQPVPYADFSDPQTLNLYSYVRNNPLAGADVDGHCYPWCTMAAGGAVGALVGAGGEIVATKWRGESIDWTRVKGSALKGGIMGAAIGLAGPEAGVVTTAALGAGGNAVGGIADRAYQGDSTQEILNPTAIGVDTFFGATGGAIGAAKIGQVAGESIAVNSARVAQASGDDVAAAFYSNNAAAIGTGVARTLDLAQSAANSAQQSSTERDRQQQQDSRCISDPDQAGCN